MDQRKINWNTDCSSILHKLVLSYLKEQNHLMRNFCCEIQVITVTSFISWHFITSLLLPMCFIYTNIPFYLIEYSIIHENKSIFLHL